MTEKKSLSLGQKVGVGITTALSALGLGSRAEAATFNPSDSISYINQTIQNSSDSSHSFNAGTYNFGAGESLKLKPSINYSFNDATFTSSIPSDSRPYIEITQGGNIDLSGNLLLEERMNGILIGATGTPYEDISISDTEFNVSQYGIILDNIEHASPTTEASVNINNCLFEGGQKGVKYDSLGELITENSPYASVTSSTFTGLSGSESVAIDVPKYYDGSEFVMKGNDEISNNALIGCTALTTPSNYQYFHSPSMNGYLDVDSPFLENGTTQDSNGNEIVGLEDKVGDYQLQLTDETIVGYNAIPEPSTLSLLLGGATLLRRKRFA